MKLQVLFPLLAILGSVAAAPMNERRQANGTHSAQEESSKAPAGSSSAPAPQGATTTIALSASTAPAPSPSEAAPSAPSAPAPSADSQSAAAPSAASPSAPPADSSATAAPADASAALSAAVESAQADPKAAESLASSMAVAAAASSTNPAAAAPSTDLTPAWGARSRQYLYVWSGAVGRQVPDRVVTFDFDPWSPTYGQMVAQTLTPTTNNEPHHCGVTTDKKRLLCGGLLSLLKKQDEIFVFDIEDPGNPKFVRSTKSKMGSVPDEFFSMGDNTFLLSEMGSNEGGTPGRMARIDRDGNVMHEFPENPPKDFNPHGVQIREDLNLMVTCDYLDPGSTLNATPGPVTVRSSVRIWNLKEEKIVNTIYAPSGSGTMDCKMYNKDPRARGFMGGSGDGLVYQWDSAAGTVRQVLNINDDVISWFFMKPFYTITAQYMSLTKDDRFLFMPYLSGPDRFTGKEGYYSGILVYDVADPNNIKKIQNERFPAYAGPHLCHIMGNRLIATDYFLDEDDFGKIHMDGDRYVRVYTIASTGHLYPDPQFQVDMNKVVDGVQLRPHGVASNM